MTKEEVLAKLKFEMELRGSSQHTKDEYYTKVKLFQDHFDKPATELGIEHVRQFLYYLTTEKKLTSGSVNTYNAGLRFLYSKTLDINLDVRKIPRHRKQRKLPAIFTKEELRTLFNACDNLRDKCILMTLYGAGLRISEVASLKVADIDSQKMQLFIRNAKGSKDRYALLSQANLNILRTYWKAYRPKEWLFYGKNRKDTPMTIRAVQNIFHKYVSKAKIIKPVTVHSLRHSFATHLLESGIDIFRIKQMLGHTDITATCFYLHLIKIESLNVISPLDQMMELDKNND